MIAHSKSLDGITFLSSTASLSDAGPILYRALGDLVVMILSSKGPIFPGVDPFISSASITPKALANSSL